MTSPFFSVVIPVYNRAEMLRDALRSVFAQEFKDYEVIVVDDGSTEDLHPVIAEFGDRIILIRQANSGPGVARNTGVEHARGEYIAFLDSDDIWFPWTLSCYANAIENTGLPAMLSGRIMEFNSQAELDRVEYTSAEWSQYVDYLNSSSALVPSSSCQLVVRRTEFVRVNGFTNEKINAEDHDFTLRMGTCEGFVYISAPALVGYRLHSASLTGSIDKTYCGVLHLVREENQGHYPGRHQRQIDRRRLLTAHIRPVSLALVERGQLSKAWQLYWESFTWHFWLGRLKYLVGFPLLVLTSHIRRRVSGGS